MDSLKKNQKEFVKNNKLILKAQQRFKCERYNVFTEEIKKIALSLNYHKRMWSIDLIETYAYRTSKDLIFKKEKNKRNNIKKQYKMFNSHYVTKECIKEHNPNLPKIPDDPYRMLIVGSSGSGKQMHYWI